MSVEGGIRPAVRIQADVARLASYGLSISDLNSAITGANVAGPKGSLDGTHQSYTIAANDQIASAEAYRDIVVAYRNGAPVRLKDVAEVVRRPGERPRRRLVPGHAGRHHRRAAPAGRQRHRDRRPPQGRAAAPASAHCPRA